MSSYLVKMLLVTGVTCKKVVSAYSVYDAEIRALKGLEARVLYVMEV